MFSRKLITVSIVSGVLIGLVAVPVTASKYSPTPGGPNRWVYVHERLYPEETPRVVEIQTVESEAEQQDLMAGVSEAVEDTGEAITGTSRAAYKTVIGGREKECATCPEEVRAQTKPQEAQIEASEVVFEEPKVAAAEVERTGLLEGAWESITGTAGAIGRTVGAAFGAVFPVKEAEEEELPATLKPERHSRFVPRYQGRMGRWITTYE